MPDKCDRTIAARPAAVTTTRSSVIRRATTTAIAPLAASSSMTAAAGATPADRNTFAAPTFRLPTIAQIDTARSRQQPCERDRSEQIAEGDGDDTH